MTTIALEPSAAGDAVARLRQALAQAPQGEAVIDLSALPVIDVATLRGLAELVSRGDAGRVGLRGATPEVYKALHVAGLARHFRRIEN